MKNQPIRSCRPRKVSLLIAALLAQHFPGQTMAAPLALSQVPLFTTSSAKANVLLILDNSISMTQNTAGSNVSGGSSNVTSKSYIARSVARGLVDDYTGKINMGLMSYQIPSGSPTATNGSRGYLRTPVADLTTTQANTLKSKLACYGSSSPCSTSSIPDQAWTPLAGTLNSAKTYFSPTANLSTNEGGPESALPNSCSKDFTILLTDGLPTVNLAGNTNLSSPQSYVDEVVTKAGDLRNAGVPTFIVGFALPSAVGDLDDIAAAGGTDHAYMADEEATLKTALTDIFQIIRDQTENSAASVATNSTSLLSGSAIFQAKFDPSDWSGRLAAYPLGSNGSIAAVPSWQAGSATLPAPGYYVALPAANSRVIVTTKASSGRGIPFRWPANPASPTSSELDTTQTNTLTAGGTLNGATVLNYLRGDASNEGTGATQYRTRPAGKLGDIVNSSPAYIAKPNLGYPDSFEGTAYSTFRNTYANRTPIVYVGANDGMLHGFKASDGSEQLAFVPSAVFSKLSNLTSKTYSHRYYVDGSPTVADVYIGGAWKTVLVGGLNGGGQGIYALDVTNPASFSEGNANSIVMWEYTDATNPSGSPSTKSTDLGYTYSQPVIARLHNGKWAAIFGNGYNNTEADGNASTTGRAYLFIVDISNGNLLKKIDTNVGTTTTPNGLASPNAVDVDGDNIVDYVYAGDIQGNLWKFDLTANNENSWGVAGTGSNPPPLYKAVDGSGVAQPITTRPSVGLHPSQAGGVMVYFGTGKYIETGDGLATGAQTQTFYGIWDKGGTVPSGRSSLQQQTITTVSATDINGDTKTWRKLSGNTVNWATKLGWYLDLPETGERQVSDSVLRNGRIIFTTLTPIANTCDNGGTSWLMELNPENGGYLPFTPFDVNGDGNFTSKDFLSDSGAYYDPASPAPVSSVGGTRLTDGIGGKPALVNDTNERQFKYFSKSSGSLERVTERSGLRLGRISWREVFNH